MSFVAALGEAMAVVLIVPIAESVAGEDSDVGGPVARFLGSDVSVRSLILAGMSLVLATALLRIVTQFLMVRFVKQVEFAERKSALDAYLQASYITQMNSRTGTLQAFIGWASATGTRASTLIVVLRYLTSVVVLLVGAIAVQPAGAFVIVVGGAGLFVIFRPLVSASRRAARRSSGLQLPHAQQLAEIESGQTEIRAFAVEKWAATSYESVVRDLIASDVRQQTLAGMLTPTYQAVAMVGVFAVLGLASSGGTMDATALGTVALLVLRSLSYGQAFQSFYQQLATTSESVHRYSEVREDFTANPVSYGNAEIDRVDSLVVNHVSFSYGDEERALEDVSFSLRAGDRLGLVGPSGAGKSTMALVLLRLLRPVEGDVLVNGVDNEHFNAERWAQSVAFVPQHPVLLHGTVFDNISMFREIAAEDVERAARSAALHEAIEAMPDGYKTQIGPSSRAFSGGQLQRLGIARALACSPSLIVMDEPTSALDLQTERVIQRSLQSLPPATILIVIAHRMSTLGLCNRILVLEDGRVVANGSPEDVAIESRHFDLSALS